MPIPPRGEFAGEENREKWIASHTPKLELRWANAKLSDFPQEIQDDVLNILKDPTRGIYLCGGTGTGKTHLAAAIFNYLCDQQAVKIRSSMKVTIGKWPVYWNVTDLLAEIKKDFERPTEDKNYLDDVLGETENIVFLDDIGVEKVTGWVEETLYRIVNRRYSRMLPTVYTSNLSLESLSERLNDRIASRIKGSCDVIYLDSEDLRQK